MSRFLLALMLSATTALRAVTRRTPLREGLQTAGGTVVAIIGHNFGVGSQALLFDGTEYDLGDTATGGANGIRTFAAGDDSTTTSDFSSVSSSVSETPMRPISSSTSCFSK